MTAPPFTDEAAAWIRAHVWTSAMRKQYREVPRFFHRCACQSGLTHWCEVDQHGRCHRADPLRSVETYICGPDGVTALAFPEPYAHPTDDSATGPHTTSDAQVWLADRVCRWICLCGCHTRPSPEPVQLDLFAGIA